MALGLFCMCSLVGIHLGCIYLLAILNNAAVLVLSLSQNIERTDLF